ncbi:MAG: hypothetical protein ACRDS1_12825 [Pseudonocardiaceae bacterium]
MVSIAPVVVAARSFPLGGQVLESTTRPRTGRTHDQKDPRRLY